MNNLLTAKERAHLRKVKALPCSVCDAAGPSAAHHIVQGQAYTCVALCADCHQGGYNGIHGQRRIWAVKKLDEMSALNITIGRLVNGGASH